MGSLGTTAHALGFYRCGPNPPHAKLHDKDAIVMGEYATRRRPDLEKKEGRIEREEDRDDGVLPVKFRLHSIL